MGKIYSIFLRSIQVDKCHMMNGRDSSTSTSFIVTLVEQPFSMILQVVWNMERDRAPLL